MFETALSWAWWWYAGWGVVAFGVYLWDKRAAVRGSWRVRERRLHEIGVIGGWAGALIAQQVLRHKRRKWRFFVVTWATGAVHVGAWVAFWLWVRG